jgi:mannose-6-phosphate isomerase-like protein (cupin superfamily)
MKGYVQDIESVATGNNDFRRVLYTARNCQLVVMSLKPQEDIGPEVHTLDQFFRVEEGEGEVTIDDHSHPIRAGSGVVVPAGARHNVRNTGTDMLRLYSLYGPPHHEDGVVHETRAEAEKEDEEFDGETTES